MPNPREEQLPAAYQRQAVFYRTNEPVGTIIVDMVYRYLYFINESGRAIRYGIGVGRAGFEWQGLLRVSRKAEWPDWTPSPDVLEAAAATAAIHEEAVLAIRLAHARCISARIYDPWHQSAADDRQRRLRRLLPADERRHH